MKRILFSILLVFGVAQQARATISYDVRQCSTNSTSSCTITFTATLHDTIFASIGPWSVAAQSDSITDSASQTYTTITSWGVHSTSGVTEGSAVYKFNSAAITTLTCNNGGGADIMCIVYYVHGVLSGSDPLVSANTSGNSNVGSSTSPASPSSGTLSQPTEILISAVGGSNGSNYTGVGISAASSGWTLDEYPANGAGNKNQATASHINTTGTTAVQATFTSSSTMIYWNAIVAFKDSGGGGATVVQRRR